jgi:hypothetical protein
VINLHQIVNKTKSKSNFLLQKLDFSFFKKKLARGEGPVQLGFVTMVGIPWVKQKEPWSCKMLCLAIN